MVTTFAPSAHTHDDRYYTESESDTRYAYKEGSSGTNFVNKPRAAIKKPETTY